MPAVTYTASRGIISGHSATTSYSIDLQLATITPRYISNKAPHTSFGGSRQTWFQREDVYWNCTTVPLNQTDTDEMHEFLRSCIGEETFTFDRDGTIAVPDNPLDAKLIQYSEPARVDITPLYKLTFLILMAP